ncbi:zinc finger MYM-type protein 1 [Trichonephila clavata]|uniref:Zinc finger MYM-type protein 1 n=1 Tax=Trichonephila clavata TaxID=2740835 RepID=A0A8X6IA95_TRICU|nr:zinc finger MYM-type protein 1 [Trichonephila clavata]
MSEEPVKKKHKSGSEKRKKRQELQNKLNEQLMKTQNLFKLVFSHESKEHQPHDSPSTSSASHTMVVDPVEVPCEPFEQIGQDQETATLIGAEESEAETEVIHQNVVHLGVEYQNDIGLWQNITNEMQDFWCTRDPNNVNTLSVIFLLQADKSFRKNGLSDKFLVSRELAFRGDNEILGSQHHGNYLGILELIAEYDAFLNSHLAKYGNEGKGKQSFLSATICEELIEILGNKRELFDDYETKANEKTDTQYSDENQRVRKRKRHHDDGPAKEVVLRGKEKLKVDTYLPVLDMLCTELSRRLEAYREISDLFGFLTDFSTKSDAEIRQACTKFKEHYFENIESESIDEMVQYKYFILKLEDAGKIIVPAEESYKLIIDKTRAVEPSCGLMGQDAVYSRTMGSSEEEENLKKQCIYS